MEELPFALSRTHDRDSAPPLCDHLLLARFDIDTGSTIEARHPSRTVDDADDGLAELMLPDGAHTRERGPREETASIVTAFIWDMTPSLLYVEPILNSSALDICPG